MSGIGYPHARKSRISETQMRCPLMLGLPKQIEHTTTLRERLIIGLFGIIGSRCRFALGDRLGFLIFDQIKHILEPARRV